MENLNDYRHHTGKEKFCISFVTNTVGFCISFVTNTVGNTVGRNMPKYHDIHTDDDVIGIQRPENLRLSDMSNTEKSELSMEWIKYYSSALHHLDEGNLPSEEEISTSYRTVYRSEIGKYTQINFQLLGIHMPMTTSAASTSAAAVPSSTARHKLKLDEFTEKVNPVVFFDKFATYCSHNNITERVAQAEALKMHLHTDVYEQLLNVHGASTTNTAFWNNPDMLRNELTTLYTPPNESTAALKQLHDLKMDGYKLPQYYKDFQKLAGKARVDVNNIDIRRTWFVNLNNKATTAGLRILLLQNLNDGDSVMHMYTRADSLMHTDLGHAYDTRICPLHMNEHFMPKTHQHLSPDASDDSASDEDDNSSDEQTSVNDSINTETCNDYTSEDEMSDEHDEPSPKRQHVYAAATCERCLRSSHVVDTCNARTNITGQSLEVTTAQDYPLWESNGYITNYPDKSEQIAMRANAEIK